MPKTINNDNILLIDFMLTGKCNYRCPYCDQGMDKNKYNGATDDVCNKLINFLMQYDKQIKLQLVGGEPTIHPRFMDLVRVAVANNHYVQTCTNFSLSWSFWERLVRIAQDKLCRIQVSYHPTQVKNKEEFYEKVIKFNEIKDKNTEFVLVCVLSEENYDAIIELQERLKNTTVKLELQHLRDEKGTFITYSDKLEKLFNASLHIEGQDEQLRMQNPMGIMCSAGKNFVTMGPEGEIRRCYAASNKLYDLGNITKDFYLYKNALPCMSQQCTCNLPYVHGCINPAKKNKTYAKILSLGANKFTKQILSFKYKIKLDKQITEMQKFKELWINAELSVNDKFSKSEMVTALNEKSVCIDCGANVGTISKILAQTGATVWAFEPNPMCISKLKNNCAEFDNVKIIEKGVYYKNCTLKMYNSDLTDYNEEFFSQSSSVYVSKENVNTNNFIEIECIDLCEFIQGLQTPVDILRLDVEGAEFDILEKIIEQRLYEKIKYICVETHDKTIPEIQEKANIVRNKIKELNIKNIDLDWV